MQLQIPPEIWPFLSESQQGGCAIPTSPSLPPLSVPAFADPGLPELPSAHRESILTT